MRKRKSPRVVWLPQTNANTVGSAFGNLTASYQEFFVDVAGDPGDFAVGEIPLVADGTQDILAAAETSLADIYDSGYRLRRIVGKIFISCEQIASGGPTSVLVTAGIMVRRIDQTNGLSTAFLLANAAELLSPGEIRNSSDPWIWRRSWQLNNLISGPALGVFAQTGITKNYGNQAGSALDGPHVDQKTARIIGPEERLFLTVSSTALTSGVDAQSTCNCVILTDLRVLGSLRQTSGNRRNASR